MYGHCSIQTGVNHMLFLSVVTLLPSIKLDNVIRTGCSNARTHRIRTFGLWGAHCGHTSDVWDPYGSHFTISGRQTEPKSVGGLHVCFAPRKSSPHHCTSDVL